MEKRYSIAGARQHLPSIVREAQRAGIIRITRWGQVVARPISAHEFQRLKHGRQPIDWDTTLIDTSGFTIDREEANSRR